MLQTYSCVKTFTNSVVGVSRSTASMYRFLYGASPPSQNGVTVFISVTIQRSIWQVIAIERLCSLSTCLDRVTTRL